MVYVIQKILKVLFKNFSFQHCECPLVTDELLWATFKAFM